MDKLSQFMRIAADRGYAQGVQKYIAQAFTMEPSEDSFIVCALGACAAVAFQDSYPTLVELFDGWMHDEDFQIRDELEMVCGIDFNAPYIHPLDEKLDTLFNIITSLNDHYHWSFSDIATWLEGNKL